MKNRSMHPGLPLLLRRSLEHTERRRARWAFVRTFAARDISLVGVVGIVVFFLVWLTR